MEATAAETGLVLNVQRLSTEDGPGIRTTVFLKQCPLACTWCHNPESIRGRPEVQWYGSRCIGCHSCLKACPQGCVAAGPNGIRVDRERCDGCGECAAGCPSNALEMLGVRRDADTLVEMLCRDRAYFEASDGGVTLSGGEPLAQPAFAAALLRGLHARGVATAVDTCGFAAPHVVQEVLPLADLVLLDLKIMDPVLHERFTGRDNA
ncbi:MAG TPA: glycyl-radical enzyme activating protein, partial [bacterium]|nr:glycyl-radical enzyme activating protein [bacterium]